MEAICKQVWTPEVITTWEASMTVLQFFLLLLHAYAQDQEWPFLSIRIFDQKRREDWVSADVGFKDDINDAQYDQHVKNFYFPCDVESTDELLSCNLQYSSGNVKCKTANDISTLLIHPASCKDIDCNDEQEAYTWDDTFILWKQQFHNVISLTGPHEMSEKQLSPTGLQICWHLFVSPWKLIFAFIPPYTIYHGWVTFISSLIFITGISYIVTKLTNLITYVTDIQPYAIALTVLATGTSWPDLVASMIAVERQATADSAIANITCSNSVNIFIGIGVPWVIDVFYNYFVINEPLRVPAVGLGFTLSIYFVTFVLCIVALVARRYYFGGELGGPRNWAWASCAYILFLWAIFLVLSCLRIYNVI